MSAFQNDALASTPCTFQSVDSSLYKRGTSELELSPRRRAYSGTPDKHLSLKILLSPQRRAYFRVFTHLGTRGAFQESCSRLSAGHISRPSPIRRFQNSRSRLDAVHIRRHLRNRRRVGAHEAIPLGHTDSFTARKERSPTVPNSPLGHTETPSFKLPHCPHTRSPVDPGPQRPSRPH